MVALVWFAARNSRSWSIVSRSGASPSFNQTAMLICGERGVSIR